MTDAAQLEEAALSADASAERDPRNVHALSHAASAWLHAGNSLKAAEYARKAVDLAPESFAVLRSSSGIASAVGLGSEALDWGVSAVRANPDDGEARLHLAGILAGRGDWKGCIEQLSVHVASPRATHGGWRMMSTALNQIGRAEKAVEAIDRAIGAAPNQVEYRIHRASLLASRGRYGDALAELGIAVEQDPLDARIWRVSSGVHEVLGDARQALADAERAVALVPGDIDFVAHRDHVAAILGMGAAMPERPAFDWTARRRVPRRDRPALGLLAQLGTRGRVVHALMRREMRSRYGKTRLGYVWAVMEPIAHLATLGSAFAVLNHSPPPIGDSLFLFYLTGVLPFLMFSHVSGEVMGALGSAGGVLLLPAVKTTDIVVARATLTLTTEIVVGVACFSAAALLGERGMPAHPLMAAAGVLSLWLLALGIGTVNLTLSGLFPSWDFVYQAVMRLTYFASGIYYSPISMPTQIRDILAWNPILQGIDLFRSGFFPQYEPHWLDVRYLIAWILAALLLGFAGERAFRGRTATAR